jgi:CubicO group peptidase (beta-lactamase class C family)
LGGVVEETTGYDFIDFVETFLFDPIGIDNYYWWNPHANPQYGVSGGLYLTPKDAAKLGYLFLKNGTWEGEQIVSEDWVQTATHGHYPGFAGSGMRFGYQWWTLDRLGIYFAYGAHDQRIYVSPQHDLIVVFHSNIPNYNPYPSEGLFEHYILDAIEDFTPSISMPTESTPISNSTGIFSSPVTLVIVASGILVIPVTFFIARTFLRRDTDVKSTS